MVVALGPGSFYGSSLPRPRIYTDVKLSDDGNRVDPPLPVLDPLLTWACDAHWSMGGLSFKRHMLQGRIEGNIKKLRAQQERRFKKKRKEGINNKPSSSSVPPRRQALPNDDESGGDSEEAEVEEAVSSLRKRPARKLGDDFDKSVSASAAVVGPATAREGNSKRPGNDSPACVVNSKGSPPKRNEKKKSTTDPVPHSSPLPRRRRALLLNDGDPKEVEDEELASSPGRLQKNRRCSTCEKTKGSSSLSGSPDGVAFRTRSRIWEEGSAPVGLSKATSRRN